MRIGVFGGTFDPIHTGHLLLAETVRDAKGLDIVLFIPAFIPPHKTQKNISKAEDRLNMLQCALQSYPAFQVQDYEIRQSGVSYTVDTLEYLHTIYQTDDRFFLIIGADNYQILNTWKEPDRIFTLSDVLVMHRPGFEISTSKYPLQLVETPLIENSSTQIRKRVQNGQTIHCWVPECVETYIHEKGLYV